MSSPTRQFEASQSDEIIEHIVRVDGRVDLKLYHNDFVYELTTSARAEDFRHTVDSWCREFPAKSPVDVNRPR